MFQVGALQDVRAELAKLRGVLFNKVVEDLHLHLYNRGDYRYPSWLKMFLPSFERMRYYELIILELLLQC